jgi:predicted peptidase
MALCGGCSRRDVQPLGRVPLWVMHGTADRAVSVQESKGW